MFISELYSHCSLLSKILITNAFFTSVTGGLYKTRQHLHRIVLIYDYSQFQLHVFEFQKTIWTVGKGYSFAHAHAIASFCTCHCSTCIAQAIKAIMTWRHPKYKFERHNITHIYYVFRNYALKQYINNNISMDTTKTKGYARYRIEPNILRHELTTAMQHL